MSKELPESNQSNEEVDLGQLFKLIGNAFSKLFNFIANIFNKLFLAFVWLVFFVKKHVLKLAISVIIGGILGFLKKTTEKPIYESIIIVKQNYDIGEHLFNTVNYFNSLILQKDSIEVARVLKTTPKEARQVIGLEMESNITENQKITMFDEYIKSLDSTLASQIKYEDFIENTKEYNHNIQKISILSKTQTNYNKILSGLVETIENSNFYKREKEKLINDLNNKDSLINTSLKESKDLQEVYKQILKEENKKNQLPTGGTTNISIGDAKDQKVTREFDLFNKDLELRRELASNDLSRENLKEILQIVSMQEGEATRVVKSKIFGFETNWMVVFAIYLFFLTFLVLMILEFLKFLEKFKDQVQ